MDDEKFQAFGDSGYLVLRGLVPLEFLKDFWPGEELRQELYARAHEERRQYSITAITTNDSSNISDKEYAMGHGVKHGFREVVMRSPGRYEMSILNNHELLPKLSPCLGQLYRVLQDKGLHRLLKQEYSKNIYAANAFFVTSTPGATTQG